MREGYDLTIVDCTHLSTLDDQGKITHFTPKHSHKYEMSENCRKLSEYEQLYLDDSRFNVESKSVIDGFQKTWNSYLKTTIAAKLSTQSVLLRFKLNNPNSCRLIKSAIFVQDYNVNTKLNMVEIANLVVALKNFMSGLQPKCYYVFYYSGWKDSHTDVKLTAIGDKKANVSTIVEFLLPQKGVKAETIEIYKQEDVNFNVSVE